MFKKVFLGYFFGFIFIIGASDAGARTDLDTVIVTSARIEQPQGRTPSHATVVTQEEILSSGARTIPELLSSIGGVFVYDNSTPKTSIVDIRGFGDTAARNILVLVNGRRVNVMDISAPDFSQIPLGAVERIEVIRGGGSVLYGDNAVGGVINIITKKGQEEFSGRLGARYGSYDANQQALEFSGEDRQRTGLSYYIFSQYADLKGYRNNSDEVSRDLHVRLGHETTQNIKTGLEAGWHKDEAGLPGGLSQSQLDSLGRRGAATPDDFTKATDRYVKLSIDALKLFENEEWGGPSVDFLYRNRDVFDSFNSFGPFHTKRSIDTYGIIGKYHFSRVILNREVSLLAGIDFYDHANDILGSGDNVDDITVKKTEWGFYENAQFEFVDNLFVSAGTRYQRAVYRFDQRNVAVYERQAVSKWVGSGQLRYEYARDSNFHAGWQQTFRFLSTDEWYSTANYPAFGITPGLDLGLKQQTGVQYDAGVRHRFGDTMTMGLTAYLMSQENEIFFDPVAFANSNYDRTRRVGLELDQRFDLREAFDAVFVDQLVLLNRYHYQDAEFADGNYDGKKIPFVPEHQTSQTLLLGFFEGLNLSIGGRFIGSRYPINDVQNATSKIKPHYVWDAKVAYRSRHYEIYAGVNNIFDEKYYQYVSKSSFSDARSFFPAAERNFYLGADLKF